MKLSDNGYYPSLIRQGSRRDFVGAWFLRVLGPVLVAAVLWVSSLIYGAVMYLVRTLPPMQVKVDQLVVDVAELKLAQAAAKQELKTAADQAKQDLKDAEQRVKHEFSEQLKKSKLKIAN